MKVAVIGAGNMGGAIARGLAKGTKLRVEDISVANPSQGKLDALKAEFPMMGTYNDNSKAAAGADMVIIAVKPAYVEKILRELPLNNGCIVISLAAGVSLERIALGISANTPTPEQGTVKRSVASSREPGKDNVQMPDSPSRTTPHTWNFRLMPNVAIRHAESANILVHAPEVPSGILDVVREIFDELGKCFFVDEALMDAAMSVGSCAIAYAFKFIEATTQAGVELGLTCDTAKQLVAQACLGAAGIVLRENAVPAAEIAKVCSPGGYTIKGINALDANGFSAALIAAVKASAK